MRRPFNRKLLPTDPPKKHAHLGEKKSKQRKCPDMRELLWDYRRQMGDDYTDDAMAKSIGVLPVTIRRYYYGYVPHRDLHWGIARFFAPYTQSTEKELFLDIRKTWTEWKLQK